MIAILRASAAALKAVPQDRMPEPSCAALVGQAHGSDPDEKQRLRPPLVSRKVHF